MTSVRLTPLAVAEIDAIADFIARTSSVQRAAAFLASVYGRIDALAIFSDERSQEIKEPENSSSSGF